MKNKLVLLTVAFVLVWVSLVNAQQEPVRLNLKQLESDSTPFVNEQEYPQLQFELAPLNEANVPLSGLSNANFTLVDGITTLDDINVVPIVDVDQKVSLLLVLDVSGPMQGIMPQVQTAVSNLYLALDQTDESAVITFAAYADGTTINVDKLQGLDPLREWGFTNDEGALQNLVNAQRIDPNAGTPLYDAVYKGVRLTTSQAANPRRAIVLLTNGADKSGGEGTSGSLIANENIVIEEARDFNVPIFTIGIGENVDTAFLQRAAILTGGTFNHVASQTIPDDALAAVVYQLKQAYRVTATAVTPPDNAPHPLSITVSSSAGTGVQMVDFQAFYPAIPQILDTQLRLANGELLSLENVRSANGTLTFVPQIVSRHPLAEVNYYVDDVQIYTATSAPWTFTWDTTALVANQPYSLIVEAVDTKSQQAARYQKQIIIAPCNLLCRVGLPSKMTPVLLAVILLLVLVILVLLLAARTRVETAVPTTESIPKSSVLSSLDIPPPSPRYGGPILPTIPQTEPDMPIAGTPPTPVLRNEETNESYSLNYDLRVGSDPNTNIRLTGDTVAEHHAIIKRENSHYVLVVIPRHKMHTSINQQPVPDRQILQDGDIIHIGNHRLQFVFSQ
ncbi:MAG: VWA domain-containing protein [Chloroflexi bacterium]|nr:MAG: VWA domain-containing protein [Chloroflexota bacterium]